MQVADFGMSRIHHDPKETTTQGTITHMPPELVRKGLLHKSADVWAFGVLLWEMFSGQRAWAGMSYTQVMQAVGYEQRGPEWPASAPPALAVSPKLLVFMYTDWAPGLRGVHGEQVLHGLNVKHRY